MNLMKNDIYMSLNMSNSKLQECFNYCQEIINGENLLEIEKYRNVRGYWGTAPTGKPHIAYMFPILHISRLIKAGVNMTILIADYHAALDNNKTEWEALHSRTEYYTVVIKELLELTGVDSSQVRFVKGTEHQRGNPAYLDDLLRLSTKITVNIAKRATAEVVKCSNNPPLSNCIYPLMQVLDEEHLNTDFELGGVDQRKIFTFGIDYLPRIGYERPRSYLMTPMIHSLGKDGKMSASDTKTKIDLLDTEEDIIMKCNKAYSVDGVVENNGVLELFKHVIMELDSYKTITIQRPDKYGGNISYTSYGLLERDFIDLKLGSVDLKKALGHYLAEILKPLRENILVKYPDLIKNAYK